MENQEQLDRIEAKLDTLLAKVAQVEALIEAAGPAIMQHPMIKPMLRSLGL